MRALLALALAALTGCNGGTASVPPCNALVILYGAADVTLDCPAKTAIPILTRNPPPDARQGQP